ncbi:putative nuclease HARBI1 isoform X2 [Harpegnathos saltator]|uniref:putative nuclease HARBI1 isoform X2 n=1 Tax=Harpegnathos saltator TaxID=610380 RepID=UPI000DBEE57F|nr:putative nuclease HARBI1 isoform X2 [Harpegnathos saltator]
MTEKEEIAINILLLDELLNSSSSSSEEEMMAILMTSTTEIPKVRNMMDIVNEYSDEEICGFPGILGYIDGTYIKIRMPAKRIKSTYVNRHDYPSLTLQAVCDANKLFLDVFTGPPSKVHDARIFQLSFLSNEIQNISEDYHLLGDAAYPLKKYLLTPCRDYGNLTAAQRNYNHKLCTTRVKIENAFGLLKQKFRQLMQLNFLTVKRSANFIISCCVLYNLCIINNDYLDNLDIENIEYNEGHVYNEQNPNDRMDGETKRDIICNLLAFN